MDVSRGQGMMPRYQVAFCLLQFAVCQPLRETGSPTRHSTASAACCTQRIARATPAGEGNPAFYHACGHIRRENPLGWEAFKRGIA